MPQRDPQASGALDPRVVDRGAVIDAVAEVAGHRPLRRLEAVQCQVQAAVGHDVHDGLEAAALTGGEGLGQPRRRPLEIGQAPAHEVVADAVDEELDAAEAAQVVSVPGPPADAGDVAQRDGVRDDRIDAQPHRQPAVRLQFLQGQELVGGRVLNRHDGGEALRQEPVAEVPRHRGLVPAARSSRGGSPTSRWRGRPDARRHRDECGCRAAATRRFAT